MLSDKVILVTGATGGLGRAVVEAALRHGAFVAAGHRREAPDPGPRVLPVELDVTRDPTAAIERVLAWRGRIDGVVNAAGVLRTGLLLASDPGSDAEVLDVNVNGAIRVARAVLPAMVRQRAGVVVLVSSVAAERPTRGQAVYAASKAALEGLTRALAVEVGSRGVRVVCVRPGAIDTPMLAGAQALAPDLASGVPLRRVASPAEVAEVAAFLLSEGAAYVTGTVVPVEGGWTANGSPS